MSYINSVGSVVIPCGAIIPFASINAYGNSTPSGFLFCDGNYYNPNLALYQNLFNQIGFTYGKVQQGAINYFRTPNLMGQSQYTDPNTGAAQPQAGGNFGISGGLSQTISTANSVTLSIANLPSHSHAVSDPGHSHLISAIINAGTNEAGATIAEVAAPNAMVTATSVTGVSIGNTGGGVAVTLPPTPNFMMTYLIKL